LLSEFILLATAHAFAVASPGADFAVVIRNTLKSGQRSGILTAVGVGAGILVHVGYTLLGVAVLLANTPQVFKLIKIGGAIYLLWLAWQSFKSRKSQSRINTPSTHIELSDLESIKQGFFVNVLNPKVTLFFVALFTNIVGQDTPMTLQLGYGFWLSVYTALWFIMVAWWFSRKMVLIWYQEHGHYIDWVMGVVLLIVAMRLVL